MSRSFEFCLLVGWSFFLTLKIVDQTSWGATGFVFLVVLVIGMKSRSWELEDQVERLSEDVRILKMKLAMQRKSLWEK